MLASKKKNEQNKAYVGCRLAAITVELINCLIDQSHDTINTSYIQMKIQTHKTISYNNFYPLQRKRKHFVHQLAI
jgi:hypothetical protein